jgi:tRNA pseudouridine38-40 synthase
MPRYRLVIEYDGTPYQGWQAQANGKSVQDALERAIFAFSGQNLRLHCAGRTDTGVHATHQVVHLDLDRDWRGDKVRDAINAHLKIADERVCVLDSSLATTGFHARLSARQRHYRYLILNRRPQPALEFRRAWHVVRPLDAEAMHVAAQRLVGHHDFTTFRAADCQAKSPMKTLRRLDVRREGEHVIVQASARSFLHNQVRSMVGSLERVGAGKWSADDLQAVLEARDRNRCGTVAPPWGLTLIGVDYDE